MPPSGDDEGITVANRLRETHPDVGVVVVSQYANPRYGVALLEGGSERRAYLLKERLYDRAQLVGALTTVAEGGSVVDSKVVEALIGAQVRDRGLTAVRAHAARAGDPLRDRPGQEQPRDRRSARAVQARGREAHQRDLPEADLSQDEDVSRRVKAALIYLAQRPQPEPAR